MRKIVPLLLLLAVPFAFHAQDLKSQIKTFKNSRRFKVVYDKFDDTTLVTVGPFYLDADFMEPDNNFQLAAGFIFNGSGQPKDVSDFNLVFIANGDRDWKFLENRMLKMIVDGERMSFGEADRSSKIGKNWLGEVRLKETLFVSVPKDVFVKLSQARTIEMRLGRKEIKLKDEHTQAFRDLLTLAAPK
jgi:hypothetical protein